MHLYRSAFIATLSAAALCAQGTPPATGEEPVSLEHLVITAHPYGRSQAEIAQPTNVLTGTALSLRQSSSLGDLLSGEPGVSASAFGPGASRPIIRGQGGDRVRVLENSTSTIDASVTSPDHAVALDPLLIERVEVVRGPATLLYGNSAVAGVVNVITHRIHATAPEAAVNGRFESRLSSVNNERTVGLVLEGGKGSLAWHADAYRRETGDVEIPGFARSAALRAEEEEEHEDEEHEEGDHGDEPEIAGRIPNTALTADGAAFGLSWIGQSGYIGVSFNGHNTLYGIPAGAHAHGEEEEHGDEDSGEAHDEEGEESVRIDLHQRRFDLQGEWTRPLPGLSALRYKLGIGRYRHTELEGDEIGTQYRNRGHDARIEALHLPVGAFTGAIGVQSARSRFDAVGEEAFVPPSDTRTQAAFIFEEASLGALRWQFGARVEDQSIRLRDGSDIRRSDTTASLSTGLVWSLGDGWTAGAALARNERAPNAQELYSDGPHLGTNAYEIGDPDLDGERSLSVDLSLRKRTGFVTGAVTVFSQHYDGFIFESPTGEIEDGLDVYQFVQRKARFTGAELEAVFHLHESERHQFDLVVGGDLVRGRDRDADADLARITPRRSRVGFTWTTGPYLLGAEVQRVEAQRRVAAFERPTDGYTLVHAHAAYRFTLGRATCDLFVRGTNLTDEEARMHTSFLKEVAPLPGRNLTAGLRLSF